LTPLAFCGKFTGMGMILIAPGSIGSALSVIVLMKVESIAFWAIPLPVPGLVNKVRIS
jgi:hypothetical protein